MRYCMAFLDSHVDPTPCMDFGTKVTWSKRIAPLSTFDFYSALAVLRAIFTFVLFSTTWTIAFGAWYSTMYVILFRADILVARSKIARGPS